MTKRIWSAALALSLAGGVYLAASSARASNMGFKLERDFDFKRTSAAGNAPLLNVYYVSFPFFNGLGDVADNVTLNPAGQPYANPCVGDANGPPGPAGDGHINANDAICDMWVSRSNPPTAGAFQFLAIDSANCAFFSRTGRITLNQPVIVGNNFPPAGTPLWNNQGYQININAGAQGDPRNRAVIVGSHDPSFAGQIIHYSATCGTSAPRATMLNMPYHTMEQKPVEILCGPRGVAWQDADNNWQPDDTSVAGCAGGIFDGSHAIQVVTALNDDPATGGRSGFVAQTARFQPIGARVVLAPPDPPFDLIPGESYRVNMQPGHVDTTFLSPHF